MIEMKADIKARDTEGRAVRGRFRTFAPLELGGKTPLCWARKLEADLSSWSFREC